MGCTGYPVFPAEVWGIFYDIRPEHFIFYILSYFYFWLTFLTLHILQNILIFIITLHVHPYDIFQLFPVFRSGRNCMFRFSGYQTTGTFLCSDASLNHVHFNMHFCTRLKKHKIIHALPKFYQLFKIKLSRKFWNHWELLIFQICVLRETM